MNKPYRSKINWTGLILFAAGVLTDQKFLNLIPSDYAPLLLQAGGLVTMVFRTFFTTPEPRPEIGA